MDDRRLSRLLSLVLRHDPDRFGVTLDAAGWADVETLLAALGRHGTGVDRTELDRVVATGQMHRDGHVFTRSENGVWLVAAVPAAYLTVAG